MSLRALQEQMAAAIQAPTPLAPGAPASFAEREIRETERVGSGSAHLDIYREQFGLRHRASLAEDFPALRAYLGEQAWEAVLTGYLRAYPPSHHSLLYAGHRLGEFLGRPDSGFPSYLEADLAAFEYALVAMSEVADAPLLSMDAVSAVPEDAWPGVRLQFQPALSLHAFAYPVHLLRMAVDRGVSISSCEEAQTFLAVARGPKHAATYVELTKPAFVLLGALLDGAALGSASREAAMKLNVSVATLEDALPGWFQSWIAWGWVSGLTVATEQR